MLFEKFELFSEILGLFFNPGHGTNSISACRGRTLGTPYSARNRIQKKLVASHASKLDKLKATCGVVISPVLVNYGVLVPIKGGLAFAF